MPRGGAVWQESLVAALVDARPHGADRAPGGGAQHARRLALRRARRPPHAHDGDAGDGADARAGARADLRLRPRARMGPPLARRRPADPGEPPPRPPPRPHPARPGRAWARSAAGSGSRRTPTASRSSRRRSRRRARPTRRSRSGPTWARSAAPRTSSRPGTSSELADEYAALPRALLAAASARRRGGVPRADRARPRAGGVSPFSTPTFRPSSCRAAGRGGAPTSSSTAGTTRGTSRGAGPLRRLEELAR